MSIEKRLERVEAILDARGLDWDHPRVASDHFVGAGKMVAEEPAKKKWRILLPGESVRSSDWENEDCNSESDPPHGPGWRRANMSKIGRSVLKFDTCIYARPVTEVPAKEPAEHPAGPKPEPGEGYRILSKDPEEDLQLGDELELKKGEWAESVSARTAPYQQSELRWYRRKIEPAEPAEPEYRDPVLPADAGKQCEFSDDGQRWLSGWVYGWVPGRNWVTLHNSSWKHARIKKDA